jgi:hypothetical protein
VENISNSKKEDKFSLHVGVSIDSVEIYNIKWKRMKSIQKLVSLGEKKEFPLPWKQKIREDIQQFYVVNSVNYLYLMTIQIPQNRRHPGILSEEEEEKLVSKKKVVPFAEDGPIQRRIQIISDMLTVSLITNSSSNKTIATCCTCKIPLHLRPSCGCRKRIRGCAFNKEFLGWMVRWC